MASQYQNSIDDAKFDEIMKGATPTPGANKPQSAYERYVSSTKSAPAVPVEQAPSTISSDIQKRGQNVYNDITGQSPESQGESPLTRGVQATGEAFGAITDTGSHIAKSLYEHLVPKQIQENIKNYKPEQSDLRNAISSTLSKANDELGIRLNDFINAHPDVGKSIETALKLGKSSGDISGGILTADGAAKTAQGAVNIGKKTINSTVSLGNKANNYAENSLKAEWQKPTTISKPGYKKATEIYTNAQEKGHDISDTLVKNKIDLHNHIEEGHYATSDTAEQLRNDAGKMSKEVLRPSLEKADEIVPRTPIKDVVNDAVDHINDNKYITQETKDSLIKKLEESSGALEKKFPDGMSLTEMHDEKIVRDLNAKYSPIGDIATNAEATKNKAIADSLRGLVEEKAPEGIPVKEFNAELSKQYQAADYLESLNTKRVPVSVGSKIAKTAAKVVGASVGSGLGGGVMGGVGGYHIGGMVESMFENMPNPLKTSFLRNLETSNPEAFQKVQSYLTSLDQSGSVAQPISMEAKNINMPDIVNKAEENVKGYVKDTMRDKPMGMSIKDITKIHPEDKAELRDFTDYVSGEYKPVTTQIETDARRIAVKTGLISAERAKNISNKELSSMITKSGVFKEQP